MNKLKSIAQNYQINPDTYLQDNAHLHQLQEEQENLEKQKRILQQVYDLQEKRNENILLDKKKEFDNLQLTKQKLFVDYTDKISILRAKGLEV